MKGTKFLVKAARTGARGQPWHVKIWLPTELAKALEIQSGDTVELTLKRKRAVLKKAKITGEASI
ncbi:MAG: AbrB/MazE/SpoVT family DNA-binding domain-containing protein [Candidatus Caldarchaeum sp.]